MKKTNLFISLACALVLVATLAAPNMAAADEYPLEATVTINEYISSTISGAIDFGPLDPGEVDQPAQGQSSDNGTVIITVEAETNVLCDIDINGSGDFSDGTHSFALGNAKWDVDNDVPGATAMTLIYANIGQFTTPGTAEDFNVWHWISIPNGQVAGNYDTDFSYRVQETP